MKFLNCTYNNCIERLKEIEKYEYNWNGYNAEPIPISIINRVKNILYGLHIFPFISAAIDKSIQLEYEYEDENNNDYLEFNIYENNITMFNRKIINGFKATDWKENLSETDVINIIFKWRSDISMMIQKNIKNL